MGDALKARYHEKRPPPLAARQMEDTLKKRVTCSLPVPGSGLQRP